MHTRILMFLIGEDGYDIQEPDPVLHTRPSKIPTSLPTPNAIESPFGKLCTLPASDLMASIFSPPGRHPRSQPHNGSRQPFPRCHRFPLTDRSTQAGRRSDPGPTSDTLQSVNGRRLWF